jgi:transposase
MSMGKRKRDRQSSMGVTATNLPTAASHPFYRRLNQLLREHGFDAFVEAQCAGFYAATMGRPSLPPGLFATAADRLLRRHRLRARDRLARCRFVCAARLSRPGAAGGARDHSTASRTRRLIGLETHEAVFTWMLQCLADAGLVNGKTVGVDATTLEANAARRSIVRRDTGENHQDFLTKLAQASGETPTRADLARMDRKRKNEGSNDDWTHPHDPDAKITKMKDGRTCAQSRACGRSRDGRDRRRHRARCR